MLGAVGFQVGLVAGAKSLADVVARVAGNQHALGVRPERLQGLGRISGAHEQHGSRLEALLAHGAQQQVAVRHVTGLDQHVRVSALGAQHRVVQIDRGRRMRAHTDHLGAEGFQDALLALGDRRSIDRFFVLDPDLQALHILLQRRRNQFAHRGRRGVGESAAVRAAPDEVGQAALSQHLGNRIGFPVQLVVTQRRVAGGQRDAANIGADEHVHLVLVDQLFDGGNALLGIGHVAADQFDLAAQHATGGIDLVHRDLVAARDLGAVQRQRAAVGVERANLDRLLGERHRTCGHGSCQCGQGGNSLE